MAARDWSRIRRPWFGCSGMRRRWADRCGAGDMRLRAKSNSARPACLLLREMWSQSKVQNGWEDTGAIVVSLTSRQVVSVVHV